MHLSRRGQRLEAWLVEEESGYNFSATGGVVLFNPCNIFNARSRFLPSFLRLPPIRLSLSFPRLFVSWFHPRRAFAPGNTFPCIFLASSLSRSLAPFHPLPPTRALITNFSVFPRNSRSLHHLLRVDTAFFRAFSSHSFSLAHPMGHIRLRFGPA